MPSAPIQFRASAMRQLSESVGVYALCDLDEQPIYVGKSVDGIRRRVQRHLTSARSDVIANRQVDVWEVAFVWAWPLSDRSQITPLEAFLFHQYDAEKPLMNGSIPANPGYLGFGLPERQRVQVLADEEITERKKSSLRLPRQIEHYQRLVDHILVVKDTDQLRRSLRSHFERLSTYHSQFLELQHEVVGEDDDNDQDS